MTINAIMAERSTALVGGIPARVLQIQAQFTAAARTAADSTSASSSASSSTTFADALDQASATSSGSSVTGEDVVAEAKKYLGTPYVFGSTDASKGLDCSSLMQAAYKKFGIDLPRSSWDQGKQGTEVASLKDARPGDLIIYDNGAHVTMYVGDGKLIHAPSTGNVVRVQDVWQPITSIRRILPENTAATRTSSSTTSLSTSAVLGASSGGSSADRVGSSIPYAELFNAAGAKYGVSPRLLAAMAKTESNFNPRAGSHAGAQGLMQFMPATARSYGIDPWDPAQAVDGAARYIKGSLAQFGGRTDLAVAAYNAGPGAVQNAGNNVPQINETQNYVRLVLQRIGEMG